MRPRDHQAFAPTGSPAGVGSSRDRGETIADPRIVSALEWCAERGISQLTLAAPFVLESGTRRALHQCPEIESLVVGGGSEDDAPSDRVGVFVPERYSWQLPAHVGRHILYIGTRSTLTARMIKAAMLRRVSRVVCWEVDDWGEWSLLRLAAAKVGGKLVLVVQQMSDAITGLARRLVSGPATWTPEPGPDWEQGREPADRPRSPSHRYGVAMRLVDAAYSKRLRRTLARVPRPHDGAESGSSARVVFACPTLVAGGAERQIVNTAVGLRERGLSEIVVLVSRLHSPPGNDFFLNHLIEAGVTVREVGSPVDTVADWAAPHPFARSGGPSREMQRALRSLPGDLLQDVVNLYVALRELRPAVLHCWLDHSNVRAGYAGLLAGVPRIIVSGRNVSPIHFPYIHESFMRAVYRLLATRREVLFVNNSRGGASDYATWLDLPLERFRVLYNGVRLDSASRSSPAAIRRFRAQFGVPEGTALVGGMFRFSNEKRPLAWLEVAAAVQAVRPDVHFVLFGSGPLQAQMEDLLRGLPDTSRIRLAPPTQENLLALSAFDILLLTSRWEGTPNVAIEAQAVGTPVVAAGGGGVSEALSPGETGYYVESGQIPDLAHAVLDLLAHPERRAAMGAAGPELVHRRFSLGRMIDETLALYGLPTSEMALVPADAARPQRLASHG